RLLPPFSVPVVLRPVAPVPGAVTLDGTPVALPPMPPLPVVPLLTPPDAEPPALAPPALAPPPALPVCASAGAAARITTAAPVSTLFNALMLGSPSVRTFGKERSKGDADGAR